MSALALRITQTLDWNRAQVLRFMLQNPFLRQTFRDRAARLICLFGIATVINLCLAIFFPLWVLILGPMIYGIPHLFASVRYVHYTMCSQVERADLQVKRKLVFAVFSIIFATVASVRLSTDLFHWQNAWLETQMLTPEIFAFAISFLALAWLYRQQWPRIIIGACFAGAFAAVAWRLPLATAGVLILAHNFHAFLYWILAARNSRRDNKVAWLATSVFVCLNILIFMGCFDVFYKIFTPAAAISWANVDYSWLGKMIAPWSVNYKVWFHCVVASAFGTSMHYFVWMKAIPDVHHTNQVPTSFRESWRLLCEDFGVRYVGMIAALSIGFLAIWLLVNYQDARTCYFAVASYHGYLELAGLTLAGIPYLKWLV